MIKKIFNVMSSGFHASRTSYNSAVDAAPDSTKKLAKRFFIIAVVLLVAIVGWKWFRTQQEEKALAAEIAAGPKVKVAVIAQSPGDHTITLTGETRAYAEAVLYAKVSGYLKSVKVDKGDVVKEGQILAVIESPETDQGYTAAKADARNKTAIAQRMMKLLEEHLVSQQEADQAQADGEVATARLSTEQTLKGYETIRAPFNGTVTARFADPGSLVQNASSSQTSALPIVKVSAIDRLRVDVFVDQHDAPFVAKDEPIELSLSDRPDFKVIGKVSRVSGELDSRTKMLLTEIDIDNSKQQLVAGSFVRVALKIKSPSYVQAPVEALVVKGDKSFLTVVTADDKITFKPVVVASNDGKLIYMTSGVQAGEKVALNIADTVPEGGKVRPLPPEEVKKP